MIESLYPIDYLKEKAKAKVPEGCEYSNCWLEIGKESHGCRDAEILFVRLRIEYFSKDKKKYGMSIEI